MNFDSGVGGSLQEVKSLHYTFRPQFTDVQEISKLKCPLCKDVLLDPVQTSCGHRMCQACCDDLLSAEKLPDCPVNEDGCVVLSRDEIYTDFGGRKDLGTLQVYCINRTQGCPEEMPWALLEKHIELCNYSIQSCPFCHEGCKEKGSHEIIKIHVESCSLYKKNCNTCHENIDKLKTKWENMLKKTIACNFSYLKCQFVGTFNQLESHKQSDIQIHMKMIQITSVDISSQLNEAFQRIKLVGQEFKYLRKQEEDIYSDRKNLDCCTDILLTEVAKVQCCVEGNARNLGKIDEEKHDFLKKEELGAMKREIIYLMKTSMDIIRLFPLHESPVTHMADGDTVSQNLTSEVRKHNHILTQLKDRLNKGEERLQLLETVSFNGVLVWKISKYSQIKRDACLGNSRYLNSRPICTDRHGYKLSAKVYPNGEGVGKDSHMSLYVTIMQGEFDALLQWPFRHRLTLMLLDQTGRGAHIQDSFRPDPRSSSFQRPVGERNPSCGCPMFAAHSLIEAEGSPYLKQDTLFIKVVVAMAD